MGLGLGILMLTSFAVSWLLISTIGNNDLGWRAMLPGLMVVTPFAGAGLASWISARRRVAVASAAMLFAISFPDPTAVGDIEAQPSDEAAAFAGSPAMWADVRRFAGPADRVASNPGDLDGIAGYIVNLGWALLADRSSCYAGTETARAYVPLAKPARDALDEQFDRVFAGDAEPDSPYYRLAERARRWRIYVATDRRP
jgi:hypothetical protein